MNIVLIYYSIIFFSVLYNFVVLGCSFTINPFSRCTAAMNAQPTPQYIINWLNILINYSSNSRAAEKALWSGLNPITPLMWICKCNLGSAIKIKYPTIKPATIIIQKGTPAAIVQQPLKRKHQDRSVVAKDSHGDYHYVLWTAAVMDNGCQALVYAKDSGCQGSVYPTNNGCKVHVYAMQSSCHGLWQPKTSIFIRKQLSIIVVAKNQYS